MRNVQSKLDFCNYMYIWKYLSILTTDIVTSNVGILTYQHFKQASLLLVAVF